MVVACCPNQRSFGRSQRVQEANDFFYQPLTLSIIMSYGMHDVSHSLLLSFYIYIDI